MHPDPSVDEVLALFSDQKEQTCAFMRIVNDLPANVRTAVISVLRDKEVSTPKIIEVIGLYSSVTPSETGTRRHRTGRCGCTTKESS